MGYADKSSNSSSILTNNPRTKCEYYVDRLPDFSMFTSTPMKKHDKRGKGIRYTGHDSYIKDKPIDGSLAQTAILRALIQRDQSSSQKEKNIYQV